MSQSSTPKINGEQSSPRRTSASGNSLKAAEISSSWTLASEFYLDAGIMAEEKEQIFARTWQIVARSAQLANPGDYVTTELCGEPLLLNRGEAGELRAFYNICRHRAGPPAEGCGNRKVFRCGYHGWTYSAAGHLLHAPEMEGTDNFRLQDFGLQPVPAGEWGGLVFVNFDQMASPLIAGLGELPQQAAKFEFEKMRLFERREYVMECNWKTYIDNYLEGYHLPSVHPNLNRELDYNQYTTELFARHSMQWSPIRGPENQETVKRRYQQGSEDGNQDELRAEYYWIFPNWMLNCYPDNLSLNIVLPLAAERCVAIFEWYFLEEQLHRGVPEDTVRFSDEIQVEDAAICETVQRNLRSRSYRRGRYSVKQERALYHFHTLYQELMAAG